MEYINMVGQPCPVPVIEAKKALRRTPVGQSISILVDNDVARRNLEKMAAGSGYGISHKSTEDGNILLSITVGGLGRVEGGAFKVLVVAIGHESMGSGSVELGKMLMKSFIHSLTELDCPPEHILFFNGGVYLSTEGSAALDDLAALIEKGCSVFSCGACLNYYELTEKLKAGTVTNMYAIAETMAQAGRLINM